MNSENFSAACPQDSASPGVVADSTQSTSLPIAVSGISALKVAINHHIKNKIARDDSLGWSNATYKFENLEVTPEEFLHSVGAGYAFCAWLTGPRKSRNFQCMQVLAVDIDSGLTIEEVLAHSFFQKFGWFIYTTPSHRPDAHRFRIVFLIECPIETEHQMRQLYTGATRMFDGDRSCTDASRMFYGSENCEIHRVDHVLPMEQVEYLIELAENVIHNDHTPEHGSKPSNTRSSVVLDHDELIKAEQGGVYPLPELARSTRVFCPRHLDRNASAFIVTSKAGQNGVYCSTCSQTFWPKWNHRSHLHNFDFYSFEQNLIEIGYEEEQHPAEWLDDDAPAEYREMVDEKSVFMRDAQLLGNAGFPDFAGGVKCVRSPKGTGKTYVLERAVERYKAQKKSVLLIVHRQALAESLARRLKMHCYLDKLDDYVDRDEVRRHCVVCLDSLPRYLNSERHLFDVVLIDEVEQVYSHVLSSTLQGKRKPCFEMLRSYVQRAKTVVLCDADLGWLTFNVTALLREDGEGPVHFYVNRFMRNRNPEEPRHIVQMYEKKEQLLDYMISVVGSGGKQFVACNSKKHAKTIKALLHERFGEKIRIKIITSDNSTTTEGRNFITTIKESSAGYDVLIVSPSVGTGVDINIPDHLPQFTDVFGFFEAGVTTHFEMDQQLARVRNMRQQHVWISSARMYLEYEVDAVRQNVLARGELPEVLKGFDWEGRPQYHENDKLIEVYAQVTSMRHASLNNVREHFIELKRREGWDIHHSSHEVTDSKKLMKAYHGVEKRVVEDEFSLIAAATRINTAKYRELRDKQTVTIEEKARMARFQIEDFYGVKDVSFELAKLDNRGQYRKCIRLYSLFVATKLQRDAYVLSERGRSVLERTDYVAQCKLLNVLLRAAGVVDERGKLDTLAEFESSTLGAFVDAVELHTQKIGLVLGVSVRGDLREKPMMQLSALMKLLGLATTRRNQYSGVKKTYLYRLDLDSIEQIEKHRKKFASGLKGVRVHADPLTEEHLMLVSYGDEKPVRLRNSGRKAKGQPIEPNPFDIDEGIIPLTPMDG